MMLRLSVMLLLISLVSPMAVGPAFAQKPTAPQKVLEQNLDANGLIRVHDQGTVSVQGAVWVDNLIDVLGRLDAILTRMENSFQVAGTVQVGNLPLSPRPDAPAIYDLRVREQGTVDVAVTNWLPQPDVQNVNLLNPLPVPIAGAVSLTQVAGDLPYPVQVANGPSQPVPVSGSVNVGNLPPIQQVAGTVSVANLPTSHQVEVTGPVDSGGSIRVASGRRGDNVFLGAIQVPPNSSVEYAPVDISGAQKVTLWYWASAPSVGLFVFWQAAPGARVIHSTTGLLPTSTWKVEELTTMKGPYMVVRVDNIANYAVTVSCYAYVTW